MKLNKLYGSGLVAWLAVFSGCEAPKDALTPKSPSAAASQASPGPSAANLPKPKPQKIILAYSFSGNDGKWPPAEYDFSEVTHITRAFLPVKEDGSMTDNGIFDPKLTELAKQHGVKLLASVGGWNGELGEKGFEPWLKMVRDPKARARFFDNLDKIITSHGYDGVDIDWEPTICDTNYQCKPEEADAQQKTFAEFFVALRARFPKWILTAAIQPSLNTLARVTWKDVAGSLDYVNLMTYDYGGSWSHKAAHNASLYAPTDVEDKDTQNVNGSVTALLEKYSVPASKLLLGVPFYGKEFSTDKMGQPVKPGMLHVGEPIDYSAAAQLIVSGEYEKKWDNGGHISYLERKSGGHTVSYDDEKAITEKCEYAKQKGLAGVFTWSLGTDLYAGRPVLLDTMAKSMGVPPTQASIDDLKKYYENRISAAKKLSQDIVKAQSELVRLEKDKPHKLWDPLQAFSGLGGTKSDRKGLETQIDRAEKLLYTLKSKMDDVDKELDAVPLANRAGRLLKAEGPGLLVSDFEDGSITHKAGGNWEAEYDQNKLGTTLNPSPFKVASGGYKGSKSSLRFFGHYGKTAGGVWPWADISASMPTTDLSQFKGIRFAAKGDGKKYLVVLRRAAVRDYAHFRAVFTATKEWTPVEVKFDDFKQPDWGHQLQRAFVDVTSIAFMPGVSFNDEDYDVSIDNVELFK